MYNKLKELNEESLEKYYWLGFLFADGHFSETNRLSITLAIKDLTHLEKLCDFLKISRDNIKIYKSLVKNKEYLNCRLAVMDTATISELKNKFQIDSNKTTNPCAIKQITGDNLIAFKIGFIDGDGSIQYQTNRKDVKISIKNHKNWLENLIYMFGSAYINAAGYSFVTISDSQEVCNLKGFALKTKLPVMSRKWDKIDENFVSKQSAAKKWHPEAKSLFEKGQTALEISKKLGKKYTTVYNAIHRSKNDTERK